MLVHCWFQPHLASRLQSDRRCVQSAVYVDKENRLFHSHVTPLAHHLLMSMCVCVRVCMSEKETVLLFLED